MGIRMTMDHNEFIIETIGSIIVSWSSWLWIIMLMDHHDHGSSRCVFMMRDRYLWEGWQSTVELQGLVCHSLSLFVWQGLYSLCLFEYVRKADHSFVYMGGLSRHHLWVVFLTFETDDPPLALSLLETEEPWNQMTNHENQWKRRKCCSPWA